MTDSSHQDPRWPYPGACWWKFDFHAHTPASVDARDPDPATGVPVTPRDWLLGFMRAEVDCVAVTDHNSGDWIDKLKAELADMSADPPEAFRPLYLFPGVELSVNGGFHLLAIFGSETTTSDIDTLLGAVRYKGPRGNSDHVTSKSAVEVVETVLKADGVPIPAHTDRKKGLLRLGGTGRSAEIDAKTVEQVLGVDGILAIETVDRTVPKPEIYSRRRLEWTEVIGSDSHPPYTAHSNQRPGSRYTWVKMADPSLEGLRLALLDGDRFSIRRSDEGTFDPFRVPGHCIESLRVQDARYMGRGEPAELRFNPLLNAIVGGRGTGKSTVVHALRLVARREPEVLGLNEDSIPRSTFERFNQVAKSRDGDGALTALTDIQWTVTRKGIRHRVTCRPGAAPSKHDVEEQDRGGNWIESASQSVSPTRFPLRVYSQGQIAELATGSRPALLQLIDEAAGASRLQHRLAEASSAYHASKSRIRLFEGQLARQDDVAVALADVERKLKRFETSDHATVLGEYRNRSRQQREAERRLSEVEDAARRIDALAGSIELDDLPDALADGDSAADAQFRDVMRALRAAVEEASHDLLDVAGNLRTAATGQEQALSAGAWQEAAADATTAYESLVVGLEAEGVADPAEYGQLVQERRRLREQLDILASKGEERDRLVGECKAQLGRMLDVRRALSAAREQFLADTLAQNQFVRISIRRYGDSEREIERSLRTELGVLDDRFESDILSFETGKPKGIVAELLRDLPSDPSHRGPEIERRISKLKEKMESACSGGRPFGGRFNNYLKREAGRDPVLLDRLWCWFPDDGLNVEYSRQGDGKDFRPIGQASAGQRSAAMLAFLLAYGEGPLVLDQPEDDLDNHLIYDLVVRQIRENKVRRQIIVVTHNPNIVVNGDAEMLHVMEFVNGQCVIQSAGSLQDQKIRERVCDVMEGGREAFESRYRRLGREPERV